MEINKLKVNSLNKKNDINSPHIPDKYPTTPDLTKDNSNLRTTKDSSTTLEYSGPPGPPGKDSTVPGPQGRTR